MLNSWNVFVEVFNKVVVFNVSINKHTSKILILCFCFSLSECYFAGKGTALVLPDKGEKEGKESIDDECLSLQGSVGRFGTTSDKSLLQGNNTIQKHLQSMFYLLCPEDTLKMVGRFQNMKESKWNEVLFLNILFAAFHLILMISILVVILQTHYSL